MKQTVGKSTEWPTEVPPGPDAPVAVDVARLPVAKLEVTPTRDANDVAEAGVVKTAAVITASEELASNRFEA